MRWSIGHAININHIFYGKYAFRGDMRLKYGRKIKIVHICDGNYAFQWDMQWNIGHIIVVLRILYGKDYETWFDLTIWREGGRKGMRAFLSIL